MLFNFNFQKNASCSNNIYNYGTKERVDKLKSILKNRQKSLTVVMENISDPHNISACLRSCDAVGILEVCIVYDDSTAINLFSTSSASASKWIEIRPFSTIKECFEALRNENKKIFTTHLSSKAVSLYDLDLTQNIAFVFGNEHSGVSQEAVDLADGNFLIPQIGIIQSLNISVACAVSVFEAIRQRQQNGMLSKAELSENEINTKLIKWLLK